MDYQFIFDKRSKRHSIELEGEHFVLSSYLNDELGAQGISAKVLVDFKRSLATNCVIDGREWSLICTEGDVLIYHNNVADLVTDGRGNVRVNEADDEFGDNDGLALSITEQVVQCGLDDLVYLVDKWLEFIEV